MRVNSIISKFLCILFIFAVCWGFRRLDKKATNSIDLSFPHIQRLENGRKFLLLTIASKETVGFQQFRRSVKINRLPLKVLGLDQPWQGLGQKIVLLRQELENYRHDPHQIIMFADAYDVLINGGIDQIVEKFLRSDAKVLFSAEYNCSPDDFQRSKYPRVEVGKPFLNSGLFIGYGPELYGIVAYKPFPAQDNDQRYFTEIYLDEKLRKQFQIRLDHRCEMFQTIEGGINNIDLLFEGSKGYLANLDFGTRPLVIHTPGFFKPYFLSTANFIPKVWDPENGCTACLENTINLTNLSCRTTQKFLDKILLMDFPKEKIDVIIFKWKTLDRDVIDEFKETHESQYRRIKIVSQIRNESTEEFTDRDLSIQECILNKCDYYFHVDSDVSIDHPDTLRLLIEQNRPVVAPLLFGPDRKSNNFYGYPELDDFVPYFRRTAVERRRGLWLVNGVGSCFLVRADVFHRERTKPWYEHPEYRDSDMAFSSSLTAENVPIYLSNRLDFGHSVGSGKFGGCTIFSCGLD